MVHAIISTFTVNPSPECDLSKGIREEVQGRESRDFMETVGAETESIHREPAPYTDRLAVDMNFTVSTPETSSWEM